MKVLLFSFIDLDSYIGIILGIIILVISGIASVRKRKDQQANVPQRTPRRDEAGFYETGPVETGPVRNEQNPLEKLELLLSGQRPFGSFNEPRFADDEEVVPPENKEGTKTEMDLPEEGIRITKAEDLKGDLPSSAGSAWERNNKDGKFTLDQLFTDLNEIKKAVIYSEIFHRKYT